MANKQTLQFIEQTALVACLAAKNAERLYHSLKDQISEPTDRLAARAVVLMKTAERLRLSLLPFGTHSEAYRKSQDATLAACDLGEVFGAGHRAVMGGPDSEASKASAELVNALTDLADTLSKGCRAMRLELGLPVIEQDEKTRAFSLRHAAEIPPEEKETTFARGRWALNGGAA